MSQVQTDPEGTTTVEAPTATLGSAAREYIDRVRGGDVGPLPAVLGLVVLLVVFSTLRPDTFTNSFNFANLLIQSAPVIVIAMGLVFVLLIGEIDLSVAFVSGVAGVIVAEAQLPNGLHLPWYLCILLAVGGATL
ncbi:MAG: D-xylose transport system permease protein, partial [Actinomycetota bacterium]|nr:D-xylose transport system permease protein [Actinomycetota bacterium]